MTGRLTVVPKFLNQVLDAMAKEDGKLDRFSVVVGEFPVKVPANTPAHLRPMYEGLTEPRVCTYESDPRRRREADRIARIMYRLTKERLRDQGPDVGGQA